MYAGEGISNVTLVVPVVAPLRTFDSTSCLLVDALTLLVNSRIETYFHSILSTQVEGNFFCLMLFLLLKGMESQVHFQPFLR
jgi:hypothetical protein